MKRQPHWLVRPHTIRALWYIFIAVLTGTVIADIVLHKHAYFAIDGIFGFFAWYGFATCAAFIIVAKLIGVVLKRKDRYYDN